MDSPKNRYDGTSILSQLDTSGAFARDDEREDALYYARDRFVSHLDTRALGTVERIIGALVMEKHPVILDLMASWDSHLPSNLVPRTVVGLGMNRHELESNPALDQYVLHDLNKEPRLPFADRSFDVVINTVSVDYLTRPIEVFQDAGRVLTPGGLFLVVFSNRFFPEKVTRIWRDAFGDERVELVRTYFERAGCFAEARTWMSMGAPRPGGDKYASSGLPSDPVYAVYAERAPRPPARRPRATLDLDDRPAMPAPVVIAARKAALPQTLRCPYCLEKLSKWAVPDDPFIEWDAEFMYICFNDACPYVVRGWKTMYAQGNHGMSYRLMYNPKNRSTVAVPIYSLKALREGIVDEEPVEQDARHHRKDAPAL